MAQIYQNIQATLAGVNSRNNAAFADLFSQAITTVGGDIDVLFTAAFTMTTTAVVDTLCFVKFQLLLDGAVIADAGAGFQDVIAAATSAVERAAAVINKRLTGVAAGAHTVKIQWATDGANTTASIDPTIATSPDQGVLRVREIIN